MTSKIVVVVDGEPGFGETLQDVFEDQGYSVRLAFDGAEALALLERMATPPCIVILDLLLPVLDGNELYRWMQAHPVLCKVAVVVATSDPSRAPPGVLLMKKPVNHDVLLATVRRCCDESISVAS